ncbi:MAG TPA: oxidoreductase-like domain-containing protein [Burkholderiales bacterium]|nr:oxidoreductase-like domain-containing protein [Burkholderiales bacterium]
MIPRTPTEDDPPPQPPREPAPEECCQSGCDPCVFDRYYQALERYREALRQWHQRHPEAGNQPSPGPD